MSLKLYLLPDPTKALSADMSFSNPLTIAFDGITGGVLEMKLYVRADEDITDIVSGVNPWYQYTDVSVEPSYAEQDYDLISGTEGYSWKLCAGNQQPLPEQWDLLSPGNTIELSDITDTNTFLPFWLRVAVPAGVAIFSTDKIHLRISAVGEYVD